MESYDVLKPYDIPALQALEVQHQIMLRQHFFDFFDNHDYEKDTRAVTSQAVSNLSDMQSTYYGRGLYLIQTDYKADENPCTHVVGDLKTIYRGHCYTVKKRLVSHLMNDVYRAGLPEKGVRYDVCMKLDDKNGINIGIAI